MFGLAAVIILCPLLVAAWLLRSASLKGVMGEARVRRALRRRLSDKDYILFDGLTLPTGDGTTQIDHIVLSRFGVFVIETKNMKGWIYGGVDQAHWTQVIYAHKSQFQNPIRQNYKHVKAVQEVLDIKAHQIYSVVAFVGRSAPKTQMPTNVVWGVESLVELIRSKRILLIQEDEIDVAARRLSTNVLKPSFRTRLAHVRHVKTLARRRPNAARCPRCGGLLVERTNKESGVMFLGCSRFPKCAGTRSFPPRGTYH